MPNYSSIKELVIDVCSNECGIPSYERLTRVVVENFPASRWHKRHYDWYKSRIRQGKIAVPGIGLMDQACIENEEIHLPVISSLRSYLAANMEVLEAGLTEVKTHDRHDEETGRTNMLARDACGILVAIELKAGMASDTALWRLIGRMAYLVDIYAQKDVRGILMASDFDRRVTCAAKGLANVSLKKHQITFKLIDAT
jgi:hypothetical protein